MRFFYGEYYAARETAWNAYKSASCKVEREFWLTVFYDVNIADFYADYLLFLLEV